MRRFVRSTLLLLLTLPAAGAAADSLEHARHARTLLGPETWARLIEVGNTSERSLYPPTFHALVFELGGLLWFYADADGTQSFSLHRDRLAAEKADFAPLLRDIDPGLTLHAILPEDIGGEASDRAAKEALPNGCFIESYAALRERAARGELILGARLLSFYAEGRRRGHTVLVYETPRGAFVLDPAVGGKRLRLNRRNADDALAVAGKLHPRQSIAQARWVPMMSALDAPLLAALDRKRGLHDETTALQ